MNKNEAGDFDFPLVVKKNWCTLQTWQPSSKSFDFLIDPFLKTVTTPSQNNKVLNFLHGKCSILDKYFIKSEDNQVPNVTD